MGSTIGVLRGDTRTLDYAHIVHALLRVRMSVLILHA